MITLVRPLPTIIATVVILLCTAQRQQCHAQAELENIIVETYYLSDGNDATDTTGGGLAAGSRTHRIYIDLAPGNALRAVYGRTDHPLIFSSTAPFFNHLDRGRTYGHEINNNALDEGTVALDSWLALGGASNQRRGVLKTLDPDGSILGGTNNDGGSAEVEGGLLVNADAEAGVPLTEQDGLHPVEPFPVLPPSFLVFGDDPTTAFLDSTLVNTFLSENFRMGCATPGVQGPTSENQILIAQLTTTGELTFELNVEIQRADGSVVHFVARDTLLAENETPSGLLVYPPQCGCTDPAYLEYDQSAGCDDGSCQTAIIFGCLDQAACNYDPEANFNVPLLCCYGPTDCNGLDVNIVCPGVSLDERDGAEASIGVYPNPAQGDHLFITATGLHIEAFALHDLYGRLIQWTSVEPGLGIMTLPIDHLNAGIYQLSFTTQAGTILKRVVVE